MSIFVTMLAILGTMLYPENAYAYIDPGTGSIILQVIFGSIATFMIFFKRIRLTVSSYFSKDRALKNGD